MLEYSLDNLLQSSKRSFDLSFFAWNNIHKPGINLRSKIIVNDIQQLINEILYTKSTSKKPVTNGVYLYPELMGRGSDKESIWPCSHQL